MPCQGYGPSGLVSSPHLPRLHLPGRTAVSQSATQPRRPARISHPCGPASTCPPAAGPGPRRAAVLQPATQPLQVSSLRSGHRAALPDTVVAGFGPASRPCTAGRAGVTGRELNPAQLHPPTWQVQGQGQPGRPGRARLWQVAAPATGLSASLQFRARRIIGAMRCKPFIPCEFVHQWLCFKVQ
jgi:hypothetical protein